ncbi:hypothetical protein T10_3419 [Trichinella papuae]|uniref:Uncharacterized protein n=1 Tax=Trichinella papuae TaxID=268474 RepID=A0A0V1MGS8_9BILA|nr:hypothetical protein T10_3419 [Trichinella papuae]
MNFAKFNCLSHDEKRQQQHQQLLLKFPNQFNIMDWIIKHDNNNNNKFHLGNFPTDDFILKLNKINYHCGKEKL